MNLIIHPTLNAFSACKCQVSFPLGDPLPTSQYQTMSIFTSYKFVFQVLVAKQQAPQSWCKGGCIEFKWCVPPSVPWGHVKVHTSALRRWILRTMNTVSKRRRALLDNCCVREQLPQVAITRELGPVIWRVFWSLNKQLKKQNCWDCARQEILLGLQLTPSRSLLLNCHRNTAHTELSHWTLHLLRFAIDTAPTELSQ